MSSKFMNFHANMWLKYAYFSHQKGDKIDV